MFVMISEVTTKINIKRTFDKQANRGGKLNIEKRIQKKKRKERKRNRAGAKIENYSKMVDLKLNVIINYSTVN